MRRYLLAVLAGCAGLTSTLAAQSVAGEWDAAFNTPGGVRTFKLVFHVSGDQLTGTVKRAAGEVPLAGTVKGDTVSFSYTIVYNESPLVLTVTARVHGDSLTGVVDFGGAAQEEFSAKRVARAPPAGDESRERSCLVDSYCPARKSEPLGRLGTSVARTWHRGCGIIPGDLRLAE